MKEIKMDPFDVVITMPEDPDNKGAIFCSYRSPGGDGATLINGNGGNIVPMTLLFLDNLMGSFDQEGKTRFINVLAEHLVEMTKDVDGIEAMMIRRRAADGDEND